MPGHPQGSNRGLIPAKGLTIGNTTGSATFGVNSTGLTLDGGLKLKNTTGQLSANSTALKVAKNIQVATLSTKLIDANSTGVRVGGSGKYIKTNSTGN